MASKRSLQQFLDGDEDKGKMVMLEGGEDKGKEVAVEDKGVHQVDTDSSSESDREVEEEELDPWKRAAREYSPKEESTGWRKWTLQELAMIEMGVLASTIEPVPNPEDFPNDDTTEEVIFDFDDQEALDDKDTVADPVDAAIQEDVDPALPVDPTASNDPSVADPSSDPLSTN